MISRETDRPSIKTMRALSVVDEMPPELRACVHEFGYPIIQSLITNGIRKPAAIRQIVYEIWAGARHLTQNGEARNTLDWLLIQAGAQISAATLARHLAQSSLVIVSTNPTRKMLDASVSEVSGGTERMTKQEKHRRRLNAALLAAKDEMLLNMGALK